LNLRKKTKTNLTLNGWMLFLSPNHSFQAMKGKMNKRTKKGKIITL